MICMQHLCTCPCLKQLFALPTGPQVGKPGEEQLKLWGHHSSTATVPVSGAACKVRQASLPPPPLLLCNVAVDSSMHPETPCF